MATESGSTDIVKGKRGGANKPYSDEVRQYLEAVFTVCPLPEEYVKYRLHLATGLEVKQINSWFSNRRQKAKRSSALGPGQQLEDGQTGHPVGLEGPHLGPSGEGLDNTPTSVRQVASQFHKPAFLKVARHLLHRSCRAHMKKLARSPAGGGGSPTELA